MATILIYVDYEDPNHTLRTALEPPHRLCFAGKLDEALKLLRSRRFDLIISRVFLREESVFDLLKAVKDFPQLRQIPFVCFVGTQSEIARRSKRSLARITKSLGAAGYIQLDEFCQGGVCDYFKLRQAIEHFLPPLADCDGF